MKGFTLIETLVSVGILTFIMVGIFVVLNVADMTWHSEMGLLDLQQQARQAVDGMLREARQIDPSYGITITSGGSDISFSITDDITNPGSPVTYSIRYYLFNNQVIRENPAVTGAPKILANDVISLSFCCWHGGICDTDCSSTDVLQIQLDAAKTVKQRPFSFALNEKVRLRNE